MTKVFDPAKTTDLTEFARRKRRVNTVPYLFMVPALFLVTVVSLYPILHAFRLSLFNTQYMEITGFAGLKHYVTILGTSAGWSNIFHSLVYVFGSLLIVMPFSLLLAVLLNRPIPYRRVFRVIIVMPWVVSQTIAALLWKWSLNANYGPIIELFTQVGGERIDPLSFPSSAMTSLIGVNVWLSYPYAVVILLAALQTVPQELYEAASVDGASAWTSFRKITLPLIQPSLLITLIILTLLFFNMVTLILVFTGGGPFSATEVLSLRAFKEAFEFWRIGLGAAFSVVIFLFNVIFSLWYIKLLRTDVYV
jgi:ABC-type sugar transport system permease subunit